MKLEIDDIKADEDTYADAGIGFSGYCPECGESVNVAQNQWWVSECSCGYLWNLEIKIIGEKD